MTAGLLDSCGFAAIPATANDMPLVQRLQRSQRFRVRVIMKSLVSSTRFINLTAFAWTNNTEQVMTRNISGATFDLAAATLSVGVRKRRVP